MNQPNQQKPNPNQGAQKQGSGQTGQSGQQTQQNRPGQGGYSSPGSGSHNEQSAPADKR